MLPIVGILKVRPRDLVGYALVYFAVNSMVVLFLMWFFARTFTYVPPAV
jgi:short-chain fatty acids transporter